MERHRSLKQLIENLNSTCLLVCVCVFFLCDQHLISLAIHIDKMGPLAACTNNGPISTRRLLWLTFMQTITGVFFCFLFDNSNVLSRCSLNSTSSTKEKTKEIISLQ